MIATATHVRPIPGPVGLTEEWHRERAKGIGSSDAAKAVGLSEWGTPLDVFAEKRGEVAAFDGNKHTRRGRRYEPLVAEDWEDITGRKLEVYPAPLFIHPEHEWMRATPDGIINPEELLEIKCPTWRQKPKFGDEGTDFLPSDYVCQAQHQMAVMGALRVHFAVLFDMSEDPKFYLVERNEGMIEGMIEAERALWERILRNDPPDPDWEHDRTPDLIKALYGVETGETVILSAADADLWQEQAELGKEITQQEKRREVLRAQFAHKMKNAAVAIFEGGRNGPNDLQVVRSRVDRKGYEVKPSSYITMREKKGK